MTITPGTKLGRYEIRSKIGEGGMGEVYLADDAQLNRKVALKVLPADLAANQDRMRRFVQEAQAAAALSHPNVAHIYEIGEHDGRHFIAMEFVDGYTLREKIQAEAADLPKMLRYLQQVAEGLAKAHAAGIVHRDLKPDNIMVTRDGHAKILDFGLAKLTEQRSTSLAEGSSEVATALMPQHSASGMVMGTAGYMSPEQAQGKTKEVDHRSDIFSFGCVLFEAATQRKAFEGKDTLDSLHNIVHAPTPVIKDLNPLAPDDLQRIVRRCLAKDPDKRYQSIKEVAIELEELRQELKRAAELPNSVPQTAAGATSTAGGQTVAHETIQQSAAGSVKNESPQPTSAPAYFVTQLRTHRKAALGALLTLLFGIAVLGYFLTRNRSVNNSARATTIDSIAVLPFENVGQDPNAEYLSEGITESIINALSRLSPLRVLPRSTVSRYKGKVSEPQEIGKALGVRAVLTGKILQHDNVLQVQTELIEVASGAQLWGERYNRPLADVLGVQDSIAREITTSLRLQLTSAEQIQLARRFTDNVEAYQSYLKGNHFAEKRSNLDLIKAIEYYQQAIAADPNYALAYAALSEAQSFGPSASGRRSAQSVNESKLQSKEAALKAMQLDPNLAEANTALAYALYRIDWNWSQAEHFFKRGIEINPNNANALMRYGEMLSNEGRHAEALASLHRAAELEPHSLVINRIYGTALIAAGRGEEAISQLTKTVDLDVNLSASRNALGSAYEAKRMYREAVDEFARAQELAGNKAGAQNIRDSFAKMGWPGRVKAQLKFYEEEARTHYVASFYLASLHAKLGNKEETFVWLEKSYQAHEIEMVRIKVATEFQELHDDHRFIDLVRRVGL